MMEAAEVLLMADIMKFTSDLTDWSDDTKATLPARNNTSFRFNSLHRVTAYHIESTYGTLHSLVG